MAKYTITHACGHTSIRQLFGESSERDRKIEWWASVDCPDCYQEGREKIKAQERAEADEKAKSFMSAHNLPGLTGSEKQIKWANTIRAEILAEAEKCSETIDKVGQEDEVINLVWKNYHIWMETLCGETSAKWWIDHRNQNHGQVLKSGNVSAMLSMAMNGSTPKQNAMSLFMEWIETQPEIVAYRDRIKKEDEEKKAVYEAAKQAHVDAILSALDSVDWEKVIADAPGEIITDDGHTITLSLINGDRVEVRAIDGKSDIEFDGKFAASIDFNPKVIALNSRLTEIYTALSRTKLQTFFVGDRPGSVIANLSDPDYQTLTIKSRDGRTATIIMWDASEWQLSEMEGKIVPDAAAKSEQGKRIVDEARAQYSLNS